MTIDTVIDIIRESIIVTIQSSLPLLLVSLVVGLVISVIQTVTSIQEQTLTFVPKLLAIFAALLICGHWMMNNMVEYMIRLWSDFSIYIN